MSEFTNPVFSRYQQHYLDDSDWANIELLDEFDIIDNWDEIKEQMIGIKIEWYEDVEKCFDDLNELIKES